MTMMIFCIFLIPSQRTCRRSHEPAAQLNLLRLLPSPDMMKPYTKLHGKPSHGLQELDRRLAALRTRLTEHPQVQLTYFVPDAHKAGGALHTVIGTVRRLDDINGLILLQDGTQIPLGDVTAITLPDTLQIDF